MEEVFDQIEKLGKAEKRVAMATLVATRGTSPKKEGAKMWVSAQGRILGSVTIGGCVDARVIEESEEAIASFEPRLLSIALGEEDAWEGGFTCAGTIQVMIEPLDLSDPEDRLMALYRLIHDEAQSGRRVVVATPLENAASKLVIFEDGRVEGTLGEAALDREARETALKLASGRISGSVTLNTSLSSTEVFFETHSPAPAMIIFGAGPVSMHLANLAREMGLRCVVIDGRPRFATRERFPQADELLIGIPSEIAGTLEYTSSTFVVLTAHDYKYDIPVLKTVLKTEAGYIGLLGSKKRGQAILKFLKEGGVDEQALDRVRVPAGLDIGAQTAPEIALSILAEAFAVKAARRGAPMRER
ncbi:MAG TPA: XdhC/CoxI family protein [Blastocatellia bacterium]|jgi:xanthine dehydrogenase accessory factor|nr:XdhC/CoxI family protein [Blastocatellia bacterium]